MNRLSFKGIGTTIRILRVRVDYMVFDPYGRTH